MKQRLQFLANEIQAVPHHGQMMLSCALSDEQAKKIAGELMFMLEDEPLVILYNSVGKYLKHNNIIK